ncbi:MAG: hypothetical protein ACTSUV_02130 [Candidatus Ranarchaeia archaeon]
MKLAQGRKLGRKKLMSLKNSSKEELEKAKEEYFKNGGKITLIRIEDCDPEDMLPAYSAVDSFLRREGL